MSATGTSAVPPGPFVSGLDVSHWQRIIEWPAVAPSGMEFVFIKATDGIRSPDPYFTMNWPAARTTGILRSAYHFFRPLEDPVQQAEAFLRLTGGYAGELPPALDLECSLRKMPDGSQHDQWEDVPPEDRLPRVTAWLQRVQEKCGAAPIIYTSPSFWAEKMADTPALKDHPLWVAHYTEAAAPKLPGGWAQWRFWQFSQSGTVRGIRGKVDLDRFNGKSADLFAMMMAAPNRDHAVTGK